MDSNSTFRKDNSEVIPRKHPHRIYSMNRWLRLAAACIIMVSIGFIYGWSILSAPLSREFGWEPSTISFTFTVLMWCFCAGGFLGARLLQATSPRFTIRCAAVLVFFSFLLTAMLVREETPFLLYLTYGLLGGCGVGMSYTVIMGTTLLWFPDRSGLASGAMLLCYSMSTIALGSLATWLFNLVGWRTAFAMLAAGIALIMVVLSKALRSPANDEIDLPNTKASKRHQNNSEETAPSHNREISTKAMTRSGLFWAYACWMLVICSIGLGVTGSSNQIMLETGASASAAIALVGVLSICNGCGRLAMGIVFDALGLTKTMATASLLNAAGCGLLAAATITTNPIIAAGGAALAGIGIGGSSVIGSGFAHKAFGEKHYAQNLSVLNLVLIPSAFIGPIITSASIENTGSYGTSLEAFAIFGLLTTLLSVFVGRLFERHASR